MEYRIKKDFRGSPDGKTVIDYEKGDLVELSGDLEIIALDERWVVKPRDSKGK